MQRQEAKAANMMNLPKTNVLLFLICMIITSRCSLGFVIDNKKNPKGFISASSTRSTCFGSTTRISSFSSTSTTSLSLSSPSSIDEDQARTHPTFESQPVEVSEILKNSTSPSSAAAEQALASLAATTLALLAGDQEAAEALVGSTEKKRQLIHEAFQAYDVCESGRLSVEEARSLFVDLARNIVSDIATPSHDRTENQKLPSYTPSDGSKSKGIPGAARAHAQRVLANDEAGNTIERTATKLLLMADKDRNGLISLEELAGLFETIFNATSNNTTQNDDGDNYNNQKKKNKKPNNVETFPQPLLAMAGSLQLIPAIEGREALEAASKTQNWNIGVPGDDHTLRRVQLPHHKLSIVGLGRSADASSYFLPELGIVLDAGIHVKSIVPKTVLLTHGHRDHIAALPTHAAMKSKIVCPRPISEMVRKYLLAEAQLNYGDATQTDQETIEALGEYDIVPVWDQDHVLLPKEYYTGSSKPIGIEVFRAPHKEGVPAVSYGIYQAKTRLKSEYATLDKSELGKLIQQDVTITEKYEDGLLFYTGDTTIRLLKERWKDIFPKYKQIIHEVTFLGKPSRELDDSANAKGHTHYAQLHPWICAFPDITFVCVHWSLRYSRQDVLQFFDEEYGGVPKNVVLWI